MMTGRIEASADLSQALERFLQELRTWIYECLDKYTSAKPTNGHDQLTYATAWAPYLKCIADKHVVSFLKSARDSVAEHFKASGIWKHGYWKRQEAHHGTEHYDLFLRFLLDVDPDDYETRRQLLDAVEHIGNWVPEIPPWFNEETGLFHSFWFGTEEVGNEGDEGVNVPDHLRCVNLCLLAHRISREERYLRLARNYAARWADSICESHLLPFGLARSGPLFDPSGFVGLPDKSAARESNLLRAENLLASNGIGAFLGLWKLTGEARFLVAAERLVDIASEELTDPDGGVAADAIRQYRSVTGKTMYDSRILDVCRYLSPENIRQIGIEPRVDRPSPYVGIGKRIDMPRWFENGTSRRHNPILLSVAAEISGNAGLATIALDIGRMYLALARKVFPDGRDHGCSARSVSAIARGHGRENHAGVTTAVLGPLAEAFGRVSEQRI
jgi:hypothetical protein